MPTLKVSLNIYGVDNRQFGKQECFVNSGLSDYDYLCFAVGTDSETKNIVLRVQRYTDSYVDTNDVVVQQWVLDWLKVENGKSIDITLYTAGICLL